MSQCQNEFKEVDLTLEKEEQGNDAYSVGESSKDVKDFGKNEKIENDDNKSVEKKNNILTSRTFTSLDILCFRKTLLETVEELKLKRVSEKENEEKIRQLVNENHSLQDKIDDLQHQVTRLDEDQADKASGIKQHYEMLLREARCEKNKLAANVEVTNHEMKSLKDEIKTLQLNKYSLEKKMKECDHRLHLYDQNTGSQMGKISELEEKAKAMSKKMTELAENEDNLKKNVLETKKAQVRLERINTHKECEAKDLRQQLAKLKQELIDTRVSQQLKPMEDKDSLIVARREVTTITNKCSSFERQLEFCRRQCEEYREEKMKLLNSLKKSHELVDRQVSINNRQRDEIQSLESTLEDTRTKLSHMNEAYDASTKALEVEKLAHESLQKECKEKINQLEEEMKNLLHEHEEKVKNLNDDYDKAVGNLKIELEKLTKSNNDFEFLSNKWSEKNVLLTQENEKLLEELNKPKEDFECQTEYTAKDKDIQTEILCCDKIVQTSNLETDSISIQTNVLFLSQIDNETQTCEKHCSIKTINEVSDGEDQGMNMKVIESSEQNFSTCTQNSPSSPSLETAQASDHVTIVPASPIGTTQEKDLTDGDLSPFSRFQVKLRSLQANTHKLKHDVSINHGVQHGGGDSGEATTMCQEEREEEEVIIKTMKRTHLTTESKSKRLKLDASPSQSSKKRYSFQLVAIEEEISDESDKPQKSEVQTMPERPQPAGILQSPGVKKFKGDKRVTFSEELVHSRTISPDVISPPTSPLEDGERGMFSDEDDPIELGSQVEKIHAYLKDD